MFFRLIDKLSSLLLLCSIAFSKDIVIPVINNECDIFCHGKILHYIQMSRIFNDSKIFVDMKLKYPPPVVIDRFTHILNETNNNPDRETLRIFVEENFLPPGTAIVHWKPEDWQERPKYIDKIYDLKLQKWLLNLNEIWKRLGRKIDKDVLENENLYSQIYVPYPFIIPGGRFREFYYWDSFWIVEGLLISDMTVSALHIIKNYLYLVNRYGYIPNGGRKYYLGRSQPPFLIPMVELYWQATKDIIFLKENINIMEEEFNFWLNNRSISIEKDGIKYQVFHYEVNSITPRAEAYFEDVNKASRLNESKKEQFYSSIKASAESGWDFSSRWFISHGEHSYNMLDINASSVIPVCLNSFLGRNAYLLSEFFKIIGNSEKSQKYSVIAKAMNRTFSRVFWNNTEGVWFDYNILTASHLPGYYLSNIIPLWSETFGEEYEKDYIISRVIGYLEKVNATGYPGGLPTSLAHTYQQWDFPNGWAPLQYFAIFGLRKAGELNSSAKDLALILARKWILTCYFAYINSTPPAMFEKYDVTRLGVPGGGGEYRDQEGFGWTNGVVIKLLFTYGHQIRTTDSSDPIPVVIGLVLFFVSLLAALNYGYNLCSCFSPKKFSKLPKKSQTINGKINYGEDFV